MHTFAAGLLVAATSRGYRLIKINNKLGRLSGGRFGTLGSLVFKSVATVNFSDRRLALFRVINTACIGISSLKIPIRRKACELTRVRERKERIVNVVRN